MTFCMNVSRFMNLAAIFSLDLESQYKWVHLLLRQCKIVRKLFGLTKGGYSLMHGTIMLISLMSLIRGP